MKMQIGESRSTTWAVQRDYVSMQRWFWLLKFFGLRRIVEDSWAWDDKRHAFVEAGSQVKFLWAWGEEWRRFQSRAKAQQQPKKKCSSCGKKRC